MPPAGKRYLILYTPGETGCKVTTRAPILRVGVMKLHQDLVKELCLRR